ncbi:unnamed protein product, partial [Porites lobata]
MTLKFDHVQSLVSTKEELRNPFEEESTDLISLVSKDIADPAMKATPKCAHKNLTIIIIIIIKATLNNIESIGKEQYELIKEMLGERSRPIDDSISRNNLPLWKPGSRTSTSKEKMRLKSVKNGLPKRRTGARRRVLPSMVPRNWQEFFRLDDTKRELFLSLSEQVMKMAIEGKQIIVTKGEEVLCFPPETRRNELSPRSHEEADTRTMVHIADAVQDAVAAVATLEDLKELWVSYGTGKNHQILPANLFAKALGLTKSKCLPIFHALMLPGAPYNISDDNLCTIERFIILIYDRTSHLSKVNDARKYLFTKKGRREARCVSRRICATALKPPLSEPTNWGWTLGQESQLQPQWVTLPAAGASCKEQNHCGCKKSCSKRCKCVKADPPCTPLCICDGQCIRDQF